MCVLNLAGRQGFEPQQTVLETAVLPITLSTHGIIKILT